MKKLGHVLLLKWSLQCLICAVPSSFSPCSAQVSPSVNGIACVFLYIHKYRVMKMAALNGSADILVSTVI